jgi:hypothetical protein
LLKYGHALADGHRLSLIVRHMEQGASKFTVKGDQLRAERLPKRLVEAGERLIKQENSGPADDRTPQRDTLTFAAGERRGTPRQEPIDLQKPSDRPDAMLTFPTPNTSRPEPEAEVVEHAQKGIEGRLLEDDRHVAAMGGNVPHIGSADPDQTMIRRLQPGDQPQERRLPRAGRPQDRQSLAGLDHEAQVVERRWFPPVALGDLRHVDPGPGQSITSASTNGLIFNASTRVDSCLQIAATPRREYQKACLAVREIAE